jgi:hypothetical protein
MRVVTWVLVGAALVCLVGLWIQPEFEVNLSRTYSIGSQDGNLTIRMYGYPRDPPDVAPDHAIGPDTVNIPLWLPAGVCALAAGACWWWGRLYRSR